ncbi:hypothetical protein WN51_02393 [Melipona quadrifasciata]|uniref:Uncharacterized protein n=1 Tax=Melipona quadrifasciata TaxID=166423 RepID=A0A0N0U453_9HYME|nr:hypothetical protein WN51_02393 [Melipona quadrifasciata]
MDRAAERLQEGKAVAMGLWMARVHVENQLENPRVAFTYKPYHNTCPPAVMSPYRPCTGAAGGEQRALLHRVANAATPLQGDRFTATLGTDLLKIPVHQYLLRSSKNDFQQF